jgi:hypothetical protein
MKIIIGFKKKYVIYLSVQSSIYGTHPKQLNIILYDTSFGVICSIKIKMRDHYLLLT